MQNRLSTLARLRVFAIAGVALLALGGATILPIEGAVAAVTTTTINFDEVPLPGGSSGNANIYTAQGITITGAFGIVNTAPDTQNWGIAGDDGNQFLGVNTQPMITIAFATPINTFQIDCTTRFDNQSAVAVTGTGYTSANAVLDSTTATFTATNTWVTLSLTGSGISSVTLVPTKAPGAFLNAFGCDKMIITADTPDPTTTSTTSTTSTTISQPSTTDPAKPAFTG
ncbi:unannotated protein [freshwater metagenome]|uniref:Unannotated protein n=1 Tax=freshwater metagenome TaxID=449393 RepID=A0A6J7J352_9ZZZZ|nr:hypothetical protein [Actinomycetota bacterium]